MRVYWNSDTSARLAMNDVTGFWLDYWYLLHQQDTHPLLAVRPIGLRSVVEAVAILEAAPTEAHLKKMRVLASATAKDLEGYRNLAHLFDVPPPSAAALCFPFGNRRSGTISPEWVEWSRWVRLERVHESLPRRICDAMVAELSGHNLSALTFYTRRFASELSDSSGCAARTMVELADSLLRSGDPSLGALEETLQGLTEAEAAARRYSVHFKLAPVQITSQVVKSVKGIEVEGSGDAKLLTGITCEVEAADPFGAAALAETQLCRQLDKLRLRHYVRTHVYGAADVEADDGTRTFASLNHPFWHRRGQKRDIPRFPGDFDRLLDRIESDQPETAARWRAAKWHASRAIGDWSEDQHSSASHVWQALESFSGGGFSEVADSLAVRYLPLAERELLDDVAADFSAQRIAILQSGKQCDWHFWDSKRFTSRQWANNVLDPKFRYGWRKMIRPSPPLLLFGHQVGLVAVLSRQSAASADGWMGRRLVDSLEHLYGLRCAAVHEGRRVATGRWAAHLGRIGLELLSAIVRAEALEVRTTMANGAQPG